MTKVRFYTDITDLSAMVSQLVMQARSKQRKVTVYLPDAAQAQALSQQLWAHDPVTFMPHVCADAPHAALTPVHLAWQPEQITQDDILINCQPTLPRFFSRFRHVCELIGQDEPDKVAGRQRWAFYRDRGYEIQHVTTPTRG